MTQIVRDAATIVILRDTDTTPRVLMGMRGSGAAFMPNKYVFPGGAVDESDATIPLAGALHPTCDDRLRLPPVGPSPATLAAAAIRELWEETGLILGSKSNWTSPVGWSGFAQTGFQPNPSALRFFFRAITPVGPPRRFDARFFMCDASAIANDLDDFSAASDELSHLHWVPLSEARELDLPFITQVVLAELRALAGHIAPPPSVPFFQNNDEESLFLRLET